MQGNRPQRPFLQAFITATVALLLWQWFHKPVWALLVALFAAVIMISGLWIPSLFLRIDRFGKALGEVVATALAWLILTPFFYIVCGLSRLYLRLRRIDPLERAFPTAQTSYWKAYKPSHNPDSFKRQF